MKNRIFPIILFSLINFCAFSNNDTLTIQLKLANVTKVLIFNQGHVPGNSLEYLWEVMIDSDNNVLTGDANGFDVGLVLSNTKLPGSISYTGTIISGSEHHTVLYTGNQISYGNELTVFFGDNDSCLHIKALKNYPEINAITQGSRIMARTLYYGDTGIHEDETISGTIPGIITDACGDAAHGFIDILSVSMENQITNIHESKNNNAPDLFFPNPTEGKIYSIQKMSYSVFDFSGKTILKGNSDIIDLTAFTEGIYFIRNENSGSLEKILLRK